MRFQNLAPHPTIGGNSYLLQLGETRFVLDAGSHPKHTGRSTLPLYDLLEPDSLDAIFVTHPHLDHIGSLPCVVRDHPDAAVTMTEGTLECGQALLHNSVNVMKAQRRELNEKSYPLYTHREIEEMARFWFTQAVGAPFSFGERDRVRCEFFRAGHVLGAVGVRFEFEGESVFYTGDVHFENQTVTRAADFPREKIGTLILETTRGAAPREENYTRELEKKRFAATIAAALRRGGSVLIPVFAFGKTQEVLMMLQELYDEGELEEVPVHIGGLSSKMTYLADKFANHAGRHHEGYKFLEHFPNLQVLKRGQSEPDFKKGEIYALSSGMMSEHTVSNRFAKHILSDPKSALLFVGYADPSTPGGRILTAEPGDRVTMNESSRETYQLNCTVDKFDFSGHATREQLAEYAVDCKPDRVILVHGDEPAKKWFKQELQQRLPDSKIFIPKPGEILEL